jgi:hypothetical protein
VLKAPHPLFEEWRGAILMRIMPPVPSPGDGLGPALGRRFAQTPCAWRRTVPMRSGSGPRLLFPANLLLFRACRAQGTASEAIAATLPFARSLELARRVTITQIATRWSARLNGTDDQGRRHPLYHC